MAGRSSAAKTTRGTKSESGKRKADVVRTVDSISRSGDPNSIISVDAVWPGPNVTTLIPGIAYSAGVPLVVTKRPASRSRETKGQRWNRQVKEILDWSLAVIKT